MTARVVDLTQRLERQERPTRNQHRSKGIVPVHSWDVSAVSTLAVDDSFPPNVACVRWAFRVDAFRRTWEVEVMREGWEHSVTFQGGDTAVLIFLNELLAASYGVPA